MSDYQGLKKYKLLDGGQVLVEEIPSEFSYLMEYTVIKRLFESKLPSKTAKNALSKLHNKYWVFFDHDNQRAWSTKLTGNPDKDFMMEAFNTDLLEAFAQGDGPKINEYAAYVMRDDQ